MASLRGAAQGATVETQPLVFAPCKHAPDAAAHYVLMIFKQRPSSLELAAAKLSTVFGFGTGSAQDSLAVSMSKALFSSNLLREPLGELAVHLLQGKWCGKTVGAPRWNSTIRLTKCFMENDTYTGDKCDIPEGSRVESYYARTLARTTQRLRHPNFDCKGLEWLRDASIEDQCWVLFFAMSYLQYEVVHFSNRSISFRELSFLYSDIGQFYDEVPKLMALRQVGERIEQRRNLKTHRRAY